MPRKSFEDQPYNPIEADIARDAASIDQLRNPSRDRTLALDISTPSGTNHRQSQIPPTRDTFRRGKHHASKSEVAKRFTLTREEDGDLTEFLQRLQRQSGTKVALSLLIRVGLNLMMHAETEIISQMRKTPPPSQPATHDSLAYAEFEQYWTQLVGNALKNSGPIP
jgi:hypothetical protein